MPHIVPHGNISYGKCTTLEAFLLKHVDSSCNHCMVTDLPLRSFTLSQSPPHIKSLSCIPNGCGQPGDGRTGNPGFSEAGETMLIPQSASIRITKQSITPQSNFKG